MITPRERHLVLWSRAFAAVAYIDPFAGIYNASGASLVNNKGSSPIVKCDRTGAPVNSVSA